MRLGEGGVNGLDGSGHLGRVAVLDRHGGARRVLRALGELAAAGRVDAIIAIYEPAHRSARFVREADEAVELGGTIEDALRAARATTAWLGPASLQHRAAFTAACESAGVAPVGPGAAALGRLVGPRAIRDLAAELGVPPDEPEAYETSVHVVEVVAARDGAGAIRVLGAGDCSLTLGDVAVFAESPPPALAADVEERAFALAERALVAVGWRGIGAVRFVVTHGGQRLALSAVDAFARSAPAVEEVSGLDLVRLALRIACGGTVERSRPVRRGHALAALIQARDPEGERAHTGEVELMRLPSGPGIRTHAALEEGDEAVPGAVLATVVAVGEERAEAVARLELALAESDVLVRGSATSRAWLRGLLARPEVRGARAGRGFLEGFVHRDEELVRRNPDVALLATAIEVYDAELEVERARFIAEARRGRPRVGPSSGRTVELRWHRHRRRIEVRQTGPDAYRVAPGGGAAVDVRVERLGGAERRLACLGRRWRILSAVDGARHLVEVEGVPHAIERIAAGIVFSPMPAVVVAIPVAAGQPVSAGDPVARIESMKVEMVVTAPAAGIVREVLTVANAQVDAGAPLVRIDPPGERASDDVPPPPEAPAEPERELEPKARYLAALDQLWRLALGFDLSRPEARRLGLRWREVADAVPREDADVLRAEERVAQAFADVQSLYSRARRADGGTDARPALEELWRYLHEPEQRADGLSPRFVAALRRALSHYELTLDEPGRALEIALLRMQKAYERADEQLAPLLAILERRLKGEGVPPGGGPGSRALLDTLAEIGEERFPALADLARELRYRRFDQPALEELRRAAYAQAEADLARLGEAQGPELEALVERLVELTAPFATALVQRMAEAPRALRPRLVEILLRRYYRARPLSPAVARDEEGVPCALADYVWAGDQFRAGACFARAADVALAARQLSRMAAELPEGRALAGELYLWHHGDPLAKDAQAEALRGALASVPWPRMPVRVSVVIAFGGRGLGRRTSQQHFTFRGDGAWTEDRRYRGIHPMLFRRMQLTRLEKFDLERLPSAEDVYLFRGVAQGSPKDERLFAAAEVRDLTPVRDAAGRVVQLPQVERLLHEALAAMRRFQAGRAPHQRLEWNRILLTVTPPLRLSREEIRSLAERLAPATKGVGLEMVLIEARIPDPATGALVETLLRVVAADRGARLDPLGQAHRPADPADGRVPAARRAAAPAWPRPSVRDRAPPRAGGAAARRAARHLRRARPRRVRRGARPGRAPAREERREHGRRRRHELHGASPGGDEAGRAARGSEPRDGLARRAGVPAHRRRDRARRAAAGAARVVRRLGGGVDLDAERHREHGLDLDRAAPHRRVHPARRRDQRRGHRHQRRRPAVLERRGDHAHAHPRHPRHDARIGDGAHREGGPGLLRQRVGGGQRGHRRVRPHHGAERPGAVPRRERGRGRSSSSCATTSTPTSRPASGSRARRRRAIRRDRDVRDHPHGPAGGAGFDTVGDVFSAEKNPDRKKPFDIRRVMSAVRRPGPRAAGALARPARRRDRGGLGRAPRRPAGVPRRHRVAAAARGSSSSRRTAPSSGPRARSFRSPRRRLRAPSTRRAATGRWCVLANLSGFDGSPESMRRLQLEYGAEIGRAVVNFDGPIVFCVVSRYHGGAFVVFSKTLRENIEVVAVEGARASVIGGAPAAAVVFAREVETRLRKDPRVVEAEQAAAAGGAARARLDELLRTVRSEKVGEVAEEFDRDPHRRAGAEGRVARPDHRRARPPAVPRGGGGAEDRGVRGGREEAPGSGRIRGPLDSARRELNGP